MFKREEKEYRKKGEGRS